VEKDFDDGCPSLEVGHLLYVESSKAELFEYVLMCVVIPEFGKVSWGVPGK
jgi:hypothetical protein